MDRLARRFVGRRGCGQQRPEPERGLGRAFRRFTAAATRLLRVLVRVSASCALLSGSPARLPHWLLPCLRRRGACVGPLFVCMSCQDFRTLFVPTDAKRRELLEDPVPLAWLSRVVALHCHQEVEPDLVHAHFSILLASLMAHDEETPSAPIYLRPNDYLVEEPSSD
jgi:hypothetical protein